MRSLSGRTRSARDFLPTATLVVLPLLLLLLAALQYRWTGELSEAERQRARVDLERSLEELALAFDRELARLLLTFRPSPASAEAADLTARYRIWRETAPEPGLLREVYLVERGREPGIRRLDPEAGGLLRAEWPAELSSPLAAPGPGAGRRGRWLARRQDLRELWGPADRGARLFASQLPALLLPLPAPGEAAPFGREGPSLRGPSRLLVLWLDLPLLQEKILPGLVERYLGAGDYNLYLTSRGPRESLIFRSGPSPRPEPPADADAEARLFGPLPSGELRRLAAELEGGDSDGRGEPAGFLETVGAGSRGGAWRILAAHPEGSLDAVVAAARRRNLTISFGILLLLGAAAALLVSAARRTQRLAEQQMDFVAGVTHEILTPLAAVRSAGQNLADGVIAEPEQVRRYGGLIDREGRRLTDMVGQVLELAGMRARSHPAEPVPTALPELLAAALENTGAALADAGIEVERDLPQGLPAVAGDPEALRRAFENLITNAAKYAAEGGWLRISARSEGRELRLAFEDRGPGIDSAERARVFEPFTRGRAAAAGTVPGSGLGLSLVRSTVEGHGGRIALERPVEGGCRFVIRLPAAEELPGAAEG